MLTSNENAVLESSNAVSESIHPMHASHSEQDSKRADAVAPRQQPSRLQRALHPAWLGQTAASLCWIASVFVIGISGLADWLQLVAASAWLFANIAALLKPESE
ncbi:MAG: hypothetical protein AAF483_25070 [Planctomycetota bacterium]